MILLKEIIENLHATSGEELHKNDMSMDLLFHDAKHDSLIERMKDDKWYEEQPEVKALHTWNGKLTWRDNNLDCIRSDFEKVDYKKYKDSYSEQEMCLFLNDQFGEMVPIERIRRLMYGFTFTPQYKDKDELEEFDIGYCEDLEREDLSEWRRDHIVDAILSTGDGKTPESAFDVIDVGQEYDLIRDLMPIDTPLVVAHELLPGYIDHLTFEENPFGMTDMYFDIHRRFEV